MYASINEVPECYRHGNGDMMNFSWTSAFWIHNWVANMAYNRYDLMIDEIREVQVDLESSFDKTIATIDTQAKALLAGKSSQEACKFLTDFCAKTAVGSTTRWKKLGEYLLVRYMDGNRKKLENGKFKDNGYGMSASPDFMGYNERYYRSIVTETGDKFLTKE